MSAEPAAPIVVHPPVHGDPDEMTAAQLDTAVAVQARDEGAASPPRQGRAEAPDVSPPAATGSARRAFGLDALRGLFLVSMTLGFTIRGVDFPLWMYHRQMPPPDFAVVPTPGIAWRDLAYGAFLFTMATALPLTLSRKIARGETEIGIIFAAIKRYFLLMVFALLVAHSNTYFTAYTQPARVLAIVGFGIMALLFTRPREDWNQQRAHLAKRAGWVLAIGFLFLAPLAYGKTFSFSRVDEIITGLAVAALFGSVIWYFTRENLLARMGVLAVVLALYLGATGEGWIQQWWWNSPIPWALSPSQLQLLTIVIPGTVAGDVVLRWMRAKDSPTANRWGPGRQLTLMGVSLAFTPLLVWGMYQREVLLTTQLTVALIIAGLFLTAQPGSSFERMLRATFGWGAVWLLLGLFVEPFDGGMRKTPETLSYFLVVAGITTMLLVTLTVIIDGLGRRKWVSALIDVGHNPLVAYVVFSLLINSLLELVPAMRGVLRESAGASFLRSLLETTAAVLLVRALSRRRIYWRT